MLTTIASKLLIALTGLFLCLFLVVHCLGNCQLFLSVGQAQIQYNRYSDVLSNNPLIQVAALLTYLSVGLHVLVSARLAIRNRRSTREGYRTKGPADLAPWYSRSMGILGVVILAFLIVHLVDFWYPFKTGADLGVDAVGQRDLYGLVVNAFQSSWRVLLYEIGVLAVGIHIAHGFYSSLRSIGLSHPGYARLVRGTGITLAACITLCFAAMPLFLYFLREPN